MICYKLCRGSRVRRSVSNQSWAGDCLGLGAERRQSVRETTHSVYREEKFRLNQRFARGVRH